MSGNEGSSDYKLDRQDYPYLTDDEFKTFRVSGKQFVEKVHLSCRRRYETRIAKYSLNHDKGMDLEMDLNIVLLGKTGCGKSSTANTILGRKAFKVGSSSNSVTKVSLENTYTYKNRRITVVDTPGIYATDVDNATVKKELARIAFLLKGGVHCFIICMSAGESRFTKEMNEMLELIKRDGLGNFYDYCMVAYTKAEIEPETCTLCEFLEAEKINNEKYRRLLKNIKDRVVAVNNNCLISVEALRNRDALIEMVDVVVAENIRQGHPDIYTNDLFQAAGSLQEKLNSVVQDNSLHQVMVNATIEVVINNNSSELTLDTFLNEVISILRGRKSFESINQFPDLFFTGTDRVNDRFVNQIHRLYDKIEPELNMFSDNGNIALAAAEVVGTAAVRGRTAAAAVVGAAVDKISRLFKF